jgi:hypothetical protein
MTDDFETVLLDIKRSVAVVFTVDVIGGGEALDL